jgi:hypothetical protein
MKTKLFFGNQYVESFNCDGKKYTKWQIIKIKTKIFMKKILFWTLVVLIGISIGQYFKWAYPTIITKEVIKEIMVNQEVNYPVLDRIAKCESGNSHYDKNGQVLVRGNTNGRSSVDIGVFQVNAMYHGAKATEMGLDLTKEADNRAYAKFLYQTRGTVDWKASESCWNK